MSFVIDVNDSRSIKAIEIAATAGQWHKVTVADGRRLFGVPSQRDPSHIYLVDLNTCTCEDFKRNGLSEWRIGYAGDHTVCKHVRAVRLYSELAQAANERTSGIRRRHLRALPR